MKKLSFAIIALVGFMLMTGCKKDPAPTPEPDPTYADPTLVLMTGADYLAEGDETVAGTPFTVGFACTGETLAKLMVTFTADEAVVAEKVKKWDGETEAEYDVTVTLDCTGDIMMTAILTDTQGKTATITLGFTSVAAAANDFEGTYSGPAVLSGIADVQGMASYELPADTSTLTLQITPIEEGLYEGRFFYGGEEFVTTGTPNGDMLVFDPFDHEIAMEDSFTLKLTLTFNFEALKVEEKLNVTSVVTGTGTLSIPGMPIEMPCSFDGNMTGELEKTE